MLQEVVEALWDCEVKVEGFEPRGSKDGRCTLGRYYYEVVTAELAGESTALKDIRQYCIHARVWMQYSIINMPMAICMEILRDFAVDFCQYNHPTNPQVRIPCSYMSQHNRHTSCYVHLQQTCVLMR